MMRFLMKLLEFRSSSHWWTEKSWEAGFSRRSSGRHQIYCQTGKSVPTSKPFPACVCRCTVWCIWYLEDRWVCCRVCRPYSSIKGIENSWAALPSRPFRGINKKAIEEGAQEVTDAVKSRIDYNNRALDVLAQPEEVRRQHDKELVSWEVYIAVLLSLSFLSLLFPPSCLLIKIADHNVAIA